MNILLPTDFSKNAEKACEIAFKMAAYNQGTVRIIHAYDLPYSDRSMTTSLLEVMKENAEKNMATFSKHVKEKYKGKFTTLVRLGNPIRLIHDQSELAGIDLIVMGTKGASGIEEVLIGSNASSVIQNTNKPVLIIPPKADLQKVERIVFASDLDPEVKELPLKRLALFAKTLGASIDIVHVQKNTSVPNGARDFYSSMLKEVDHDYTIINSENVEQAIIKEAAKEGADIVAAINKRYGFFEGIFHRSITSKLAYHTTLPLLVLHEPK
ncbi:MAG: nucleotide-binding universal stress UspA family protein [Roseivirga sp.]|jgi:nucleotide-binding universal stress UspA family protein